jgi:hypothetical protein
VEGIAAWPGKFCRDPAILAGLRAPTGKDDRTEFSVAAMKSMFKRS